MDSELKRIDQVAETIGLSSDDLEPHGRTIAKVGQAAVDRARRQPRNPNAKLVLVTAITPTPAGEGKTTTSIGLAQGLRRRGESVALALREPSLGPCMGMKGGATGGGKSSIHPAERINLHFTGDMHAVTASHNLLAAMLDNHLHFGNRLGVRTATWKRVMDMNDRSLRNIVVGLGGGTHGVARETGFDITAASEIMAMLCLAEDREDLARRFDRTWLGFDASGVPITPEHLNATTGMMVLVKDALLPNLVQTTEGVPALIHGGPFANIAHGCSSVIATKTALGLADWVVTEAGFAFDLGGEKFFDIKCRTAGLDVSAVVLVATLRALKMHGGAPKNRLAQADTAAVARGLANLDAHVEGVRVFGKEPVVALNMFPSDAPEEVEIVRRRCEELGVSFSEASHYSDGGAGAESLAEAVVRASAQPSELRFAYDLEDPVETKVRAIVQKVYGARDVKLTPTARKKVELAERCGLHHLPICMAKTQNSLSDDPTKLGRPRDFDITVRDIEISAGAGFLVALTGDMMRMPGLPRVPRAESLELVGDDIRGLMG